MLSVAAVKVGTLGNFSRKVGLSDDHRGTVIHELGHNVGLCHGGQDDVNCKPNYQSVRSRSERSDRLHRQSACG